MKKFKILVIGLVVFMLSSFLTGCYDQDFKDTLYNSILYNGVEEWIDDDFLRENRVYAYYRNENYIEGVSDPDEKYILEETLPSSLVFIITEENEYNKIFTKSELDIDFESENVILYIFTDTNPSRKYNLKGIDVNDKVLYVQIGLERKNVNDATMPYQRCILIKMNKVEINEANFKNNE